MLSVVVTFYPVAEFKNTSNPLTHINTYHSPRTEVVLSWPIGKLIQWTVGVVEGKQDGTVRQWDTRQGDCVHTLTLGEQGELARPKIVSLASQIPCRGCSPSPFNHRAEDQVCILILPWQVVW